MTVTKTNEPTKLSAEVQFGSLREVKESRDTASIEERAESKDAAVSLATKTENDLRIRKIEEDVRGIQLKNRGAEQDHEDQESNRKMRFKYSEWVFYYLVGYSSFVALLLVLSGWRICGFTLESEVLNFLVGSTAASAIGLVAAVTLGLFGKK